MNSHWKYALDKIKKSNPFPGTLWLLGHFVLQRAFASQVIHWERVLVTFCSDPDLVFDVCLPESGTLKRKLLCPWIGDALPIPLPVQLDAHSVCQFLEGVSDER